jgi:hypothetical protein
MAALVATLEKLCRDATKMSNKTERVLSVKIYSQKR